MLPNHEINELARALMRTAEFGNMMKYRNSIISDPALNQQVTAFERERRRIMSAGYSPVEKSNYLSRLYAENKRLLEKEELKHMTEATDRYQKMLSECIDMIHRSMDSYINRR